MSYDLKQARNAIRSLGQKARKQKKIKVSTRVPLVSYNAMKRYPGYARSLDETVGRDTDTASDISGYEIPTPRTFYRDMAMAIKDADAASVPPDDDYGRVPKLTELAGKIVFETGTPFEHEGVTYIRKFGRVRPMAMTHDDILRESEGDERILRKINYAQPVYRERIGDTLLVSSNPSFLSPMKPSGPKPSQRSPLSSRYRSLAQPSPFTRRLDSESGFLSLPGMVNQPDFLSPPFSPARMSLRTNRKPPTRFTPP